MLGYSATGGLIFTNPVNSVGATIPNVGVECGMSGSNSGSSASSMTGSAKQLYGSEVQTWSSHSIAISNIPYPTYDLVVYSLPAGVGSGTASIVVNDNTNTTTVSQSFTAMQSAFTIATVSFGSNASPTNANTVVIQGLTSPIMTLQGSNIAAFQIVERPYDQGTPASFKVMRAGSNGVFSSIGTTTGTTLNYTDSTVSAGSTYQYRVQAVNSFGTSAASNTLSATTPGTVAASPPTSPSGPSSPGFSSWQSTYFNSAQLADATISGPTADPYGSGVPNLLAYALQLNPATAKPTDVPAAVPVNGHMQIIYFVPSALTDIDYIVEVSSDLQNWNSGTGYTHVVSTASGNGGNTITVVDTLPTTTPKHFMHLRVTQQ